MITGNWHYRNQVIIDAGSVDKDLTDYQIHLTLNSNNFDFSKSNNGNDIRFSPNKITEYPYWIQKWDSNNQIAIIWVKVPFIAHNSLLTNIHMYYGNPTALSQSNGLNVFDFYEDWESGTIGSKWKVGGSKPPYWQIYSYSYQGRYSSGNNDIRNRQESYIKTDVKLSEQSLLEFYWSVSSERYYDYLYLCTSKKCDSRHYTDRISGNVPWTKVSTVLNKGKQHIKFMYKKDWSVSRGKDMGWIDMITIRKYISPEPIVTIRNLQNLNKSNTVLITQNF